MLVIRLTHVSHTRQLSSDNSGQPFALVEFPSSPIAIRSHCGTWGAPVHLAYDGQAKIALVVGSMDAPETLIPILPLRCKALLPWVDIGKSLPPKDTEEKW
jgi:hypothetical protein